MAVGPLLQSGPGSGGLLFFILIVLVIHLALIFWVYIDAETNSDHPAFLWAVVIFLAPILGLILYFLLGRTKTGYQTAKPTEDRPERYTHECESCGKRYNARQTDEIPSCHQCGGIHVHKVDSNSIRT